MSINTIIILWHPSGPAMSNVMPCHCLLFSIPIISLFCCRPKSSATDTAHAVHNAVARVIARMLTLRSLTTHSRCGTSSVGTPRVIAQHSASQLFGRRCRLRFVLLFFFLSVRFPNYQNLNSIHRHCCCRRRVSIIINVDSVNQAYG